MHVIEGIVERGDQRGRSLGFPTANIAVAADEAPSLEGVWCALAEVGSEGPAIAAVSIGRRKTFYAERGQWLLEAHLLDVERDLYGSTLRVCLFERLRQQRAFPGVEALVEQLHSDLGRTRIWALERFPWLVRPAPMGATA